MLRDRSKWLHNFDLFADVKDLPSIEKGNGTISTCTGESLAFMWSKKPVFYLIFTAITVKMALTQEINLFSYSPVHLSC